MGCAYHNYSRQIAKADAATLALLSAKTTKALCNQTVDEYEFDLLMKEIHRRRAALQGAGIE